MDLRRSILLSKLHGGYEKCDYGWIMPTFHFHDSYELFVLQSGTRNVYIDNEIVNTQKNDAVLFASGVPHKSSGSTPYNGFCIHFPSSMLINLSSAKKSQLLKCFSSKVISLNDDDMYKLRTIVDNLSRSEHKDDIQNLIIIIDILSAYSPKENMQVPAPHSKIDCIIKYIEENFKSITHLSCICEMFDVTESHLCRLFKKHTGVTLVQYITNLKILCARHMLDTNSSRTIEFIAKESGFSSLSYFVRTFKKCVGVTPTQYKTTN